MCVCVYTVYNIINKIQFYFSFSLFLDKLLFLCFTLFFYFQWPFILFQVQISLYRFSFDLSQKKKKKLFYFTLLYFTLVTNVSLIRDLVQLNEIKSLSKFPTYVLFYSEIRPIMEMKCIVNVKG